MSSQLVNKLRTEKIPSLVLPEFLPVGEKVNRYYDEYERLFRENNTLNDRLAEVIEERNRLAEKFNTIKVHPIIFRGLNRRRRQSSERDDTPAILNGCSTALSRSATGATVHRVLSLIMFGSSTWTSIPVANTSFSSRNISTRCKKRKRLKKKITRNQLHRKTRGN